MFKFIPNYVPIANNQGWRDNVNWPTEPADEPAARNLLQSPHDQIGDYINTYLGEGQQSLYRQALINGNFDIWQRGTSFATAAPYYTADRWQAFRSGGAAGLTTSRQAAALNGSQYCIRLQRDSGNAGTQFIELGQAIETNNSILFRGKKVTLSFYARAGANFSAASNILTAGISARTAVDENVASSAVAVDQNNFVLTSAWQKFVLTSTNPIASDVNTVKVFFYYTPTGAAGANDYLEIAQIQLCAGDMALPFQPKSFDDELRACKRYYWDSAGNNTSGVAVTTSILIGSVTFPNEMRIAPVIAVYNSTIINHVRKSTDAADIAITTPTPLNGSKQSCAGIYDASATPFTVGTGYDYRIVANAEF